MAAPADRPALLVVPLILDFAFQSRSLVKTFLSSFDVLFRSIQYMLVLLELCQGCFLAYGSKCSHVGLDQSMESRSKRAGATPFKSDVFRRACAVVESMDAGSSRLAARTGFAMLEVGFSWGCSVLPGMETLLYPLNWDTGTPLSSRLAPNSGVEVAPDPIMTPYFAFSFPLPLTLSSYIVSRISCSTISPRSPLRILIKPPIVA